MKIVQAENLSYIYASENIKAVKNVSFEIEKGSYTAVLGKNGSGKSTLARLICGFLSPTEGKIILNAEEKTGSAPWGIVFQEPKTQIIAGITQRDTELGPENLNLSRQEIKPLVERLLKLTSLYEKKDSKTQTLSLGQQQKLAFAGILALKPDLLILDEAVSMVDPDARQEILSFTKQWHKSGKTVISVTHDIDEALAAEKIIAMEDGSIIYNGTSADFAADKALQERLFGEQLPFNKSVIWNPKNDSSLPDALVFDKISFNYAGSTAAGGSTLSGGTANAKNSSLKDAPENAKNSASTDVIENSSDSSFAGAADAFVFSDFSLSFKKGKLTAVMGKSGEGKSTLFELASGLLSPQSGNVLAESRPVLALQENESALFEQFAADDVAYGPQNAGLKGKALKDAVISGMDAVGLPFAKFADRTTNALSGGEKRRLAIAGIIALNADIMIFDEPCAGLDPAGRATILKILQQLCREGHTVIFSTHRKEEALCADYCIQLEEAKKLSAAENAGSSSFAGAPTNASGSAFTGSLQTETALSAEDAPTNASNPAFEGGPQTEAASVSKCAAENSSSSASAGAPQTEVSLHPEAASETKASPQLTPVPLLDNGKMLGLLKNTVSGLFTASSSPVHRLPAPAKLFVFLAVFIAGISFKSYIPALAMLALSVVYVLFAKVPLKKPLLTIIKIIPWLAFFVILQFLLLPFPAEQKIQLALQTLIHVSSAIFTFYAFLSSTEETEIMSGIKFFLRSKKIILALAVTFRFIPILADEASSIIKIQLIRGGLKETKGFFNKVKSLLPLFVPLIIRTLERSEAMAEALTARWF